MRDDVNRIGKIYIKIVTEILQFNKFKKSTCQMNANSIQFVYTKRKMY